MGKRAQAAADLTTEVQLGERGRLVVPARVRTRLGLRPGSRLTLTVEDPGELRLVSAKRRAEKCAGMFRGLAPEGVCPSRELIAERRREAAREKRR